jgi:hypothetical protein
VATNPTREQSRARDHLAQALLLITEAARLDGKSRMVPSEFAETAGRVVRASSAYGLDQIVSRALEKRCEALGLRSGAADMLTLLESELKPLETLLLADDQFKELVAKIESELGDL